jgi:DUF971 family protein
MAQTPIVYGDVVKDSITSNGQINIYIFAGSAGDVITVRMTANWGNRPQFELYAPDASLLTRVTAGGLSGSLSLRLDTLRLKTTGTYALLVMDDDGLNTGIYTMVCQRIVNPVGSSTITYGQVVRDTLRSQAMIKAYTLAGSAGEIITIRMTASWGNRPQFELYNSDGTLVTRVIAGGLSGSLSVRLDTLRLIRTGTYSLFVLDDDGLDKGSYTIFCQRTVNPVGGRQISHLQNIKDTLANKAEIKAYWFRGTTNEIISILMTASWGNRPQFELYTPDGNLLTRVTAGGLSGSFSLRLDTLRLKTTGTYSLFAMDDDGIDIGNFTLNLVRLTRAWLGSVDSSWNTASNWYPNGVPTPGDSVVIGSPFRNPIIVVPQNQVTVGALTIGVAGSLTVTQNVPRFQVADVATVNGTLALAPTDTFSVQTEEPGSLKGTGTIPEGTIQRSVRQAGAARYRFESDSTYVRFSDTLSAPSLVSMTTYPDTLPTNFGTTWTPIPSRVFVQTHTIQADGVQLGLSGLAKTEGVLRLASRRWAIKIPRGLKKISTLLDGDIFIHRVYSTSIDGDATARVSISLRYDPSEIPAGLAEDSLQICWSTEGLQGVKPDNNSLPREYALLQNYPNPFNPTTVVSYQLPAAGVVRLAVYDVLGRQVAVLVNETKPAGSYTVRFDGGRFSSGAYYCRLSAGGFLATKRMMLIK